MICTQPLKGSVLSCQYVCPLCQHLVVWCHCCLKEMLIVTASHLSNYRPNSCLLRLFLLLAKVLRLRKQLQICEAPVSAPTCWLIHREKILYLECSTHSHTAQIQPSCWFVEFDYINIYIYIEMLYYVVLVVCSDKSLEKLVEAWHLFGSLYPPAQAGARNLPKDHPSPVPAVSNQPRLRKMLIQWLSWWFRRHFDVHFTFQIPPFFLGWMMIVRKISFICSKRTSKNQMFQI